LWRSTFVLSGYCAADPSVITSAKPLATPDYLRSFKGLRKAQRSAKSSSPYQTNPYRQLYGVSLVEWVARYNGLGDANRIVAGETLIVPIKAFWKNSPRAMRMSLPENVPLARLERISYDVKTHRRS